MKVPLHLLVEDISSINLDKIDGAEIPVVHLALTIKIPVMQLIDALSGFKAKVEAAPAPAAKAPSKALAPPEMKAMPLPLPSKFLPPLTSNAAAAANPVQTGDNNDGKASAAATVSAAPGTSALPAVPATVPSPAPEPVPEASWSTEISQMQANYAEYAHKVKWTPDKNGFMLDDIRCLSNFEPLPLEPPVLIRKGPHQGESKKTMLGSEGEPVADSRYGEPPATSPPAPETSFSGEAPPGLAAPVPGSPPPKAPPVKSRSMIGAAAAAAAQESAAPGPGGKTGSPAGKASAQSSKDGECKQQ